MEEVAVIVVAVDVAAVVVVVAVDSNEISPYNILYK